MGGIGGPELLLIFFVVLLVFGPRKIPEVARGIGKGLREFRRLSTDLQREMNLAEHDEKEAKQIRDRARRPVPPDPALESDPAPESDPDSASGTEPRQPPSIEPPPKT